MQQVLCVNERTRGKRVRDPGRIKRVFQLIVMAAHKILSLRRNLHLGRHFEHLWVCACACLCVTHSKITVQVPQRWDPVLKLDYTPKRKCERAQRSTDGGEALGFANRKNGNHTLFLLNSYFLQTCFAPLSSPSLTDTQRHMQPHWKL